MVWGGMEYDFRLRSLGLFSVRGRLLRIDLIKVWKCFHAEVDLGLVELFERARFGRTRGHRYKLSIPVCRSEIRRRSFGVRCVTTWNSLPVSLVEVTSVDAFKRGLDSFLGGDLFVSA